MPLPAEGQLTSTAHLMIDNPFRGGGMAALFSTHPPMEERVARLEQMAATAGPCSSSADPLIHCRGLRRTRRSPGTGEHRCVGDRFALCVTVSAAALGS